MFKLNTLFIVLKYFFYIFILPPIAIFFSIGLGFLAMREPVTPELLQEFVYFSLFTSCMATVGAIKYGLLPFLEKKFSKEP